MAQDFSVNGGPSRQSVRLAAALARFGRPLGDRVDVAGRDLSLTRGMFDVFGGMRVTAGRFGRVRYPGVGGQWIGGPASAAVDGVLLYAHGGGFVFGSAKSHYGLATRLAVAADRPVFVADYRRAPEHPFPAARNDVVAAYCRLLDSGVPAERITVAGDSAGGHLVATTLGELHRQRLPMPSAVALFSPMLDLTCAEIVCRDARYLDPFVPVRYAQRCCAAYAGDLPLDDARLDVLGSDLSHWPPTLIQVGGTECLQIDATRLADALTACGVTSTLQIWPGQVHVFQAFATIVPEARRAIAEAASFLTGNPRQPTRTPCD